MKLYEISAKYEQLLDKLKELEETNFENCLDEQIVATKEEIKNIDSDAQDKVVNTAKVIRNKEAELLQIKEAMEGMKKRAKSIESDLNFLNGYLIEHMKKTELLCVRKCPYFVVKLRENPASVNDDAVDISLIPDEYLRKTLTVVLDKAKSLRDMKLGVVIPTLSIKNGVKLEIR